MTLGRYGSLVISAELAFDDFCIDNNIKNPIKQLLKLETSNIEFLPCGKGKRLIDVKEYTESNKKEMEQLKKEIEPFKEKKEKFIINYILKKSTYSDVVNYCLNNNLTKYLDKIVPCEDSTKQCSLDCPFFDGCIKEENIDKKVEALEAWF